MENKIFISNIKGKVAHTHKYYTISSTDFLDPTQQAEAIPYLFDEFNIFDGGYEAAERKMLFVMPDEFTNPELNEYMKVVRVTPGRTDGLTHRDYLGSVLGLGIRRDKIGDIIVHSDGCDIIATKEIADYISINLSKTARMNVRCQVLDICELREPIVHTVTRSIIVASLRLDCVLAGAYHLSRSECNDFINSDKAQINWRICSDTSKTIKPGDLISLRGKGRFKFISVDGCTKKGRSVISIEETVTDDCYTHGEGM